MDARCAVSLPIDVGGERVESETLHSSLSPYVVAIGTTIPRLGLSLYSTYHGHPGARTVAVHLSRAPRRAPRTDVAHHEERQLPIVIARARCLRDHALRLQDLLTSLRYESAIHLSDAAEFAVGTGSSQSLTG